MVAFRVYALRSCSVVGSSYLVQWSGMQRSEVILSRCHDNLKPGDFLSEGFRIELASSIDSHAEYPYMEILFQSVMMIQLLRVSSKPNEQKPTAILIFWSFTVVRGLPCVHLSGRN